MSARADVSSQGCRLCRMPEPQPMGCRLWRMLTVADAAAQRMLHVQAASHGRYPGCGGLRAPLVAPFLGTGGCQAGAVPARPGCGAGGVPWMQPSTAAVLVQRPFVQRRRVLPAPFVQGRVTLLFSRGRRGWHWHQHPHGSTQCHTGHPQTGVLGGDGAGRVTGSSPPFRERRKQDAGHVLPGRAGGQEVTRSV